MNVYQNKSKLGIPVIASELLLSFFLYTQKKHGGGGKEKIKKCERADVFCHRFQSGGQAVVQHLWHTDVDALWWTEKPEHCRGDVKTHKQGGREGELEGLLKGEVGSIRVLVGEHANTHTQQQAEGERWDQHPEFFFSEADEEFPEGDAEKTGQWNFVILKNIWSLLTFCYF